MDEWITGISRRDFLAVSAGAAAASTLGRSLPKGLPSTLAQVRLERLDSNPDSGSRQWLCPELWANRLADWRATGGRAECISTPGEGMRTVMLLTRRLTSAPEDATLTVRTGTLASGAGSSGFLLGAGPELDHRGAALVQAASGTGGGVLAVYESTGVLRFREHTDERDQLAYATLPATVVQPPAGPRSTSEDVLLTLSIVPAGPGTSVVTFGATSQSGTSLGSIRRTMANADLTGSIGLVSLPSSAAGGRYWFSQLVGGGTRLDSSPGRALGPIVGVLYTLADGVLSLTAQCLPAGPAAPTMAELYRRTSGGWIKVASAPINPTGCHARFRVAGWPAAAATDVEVRVGAVVYPATIAAEPAGRPLRLAVVNCSAASARPLDRRSPVSPEPSVEQPLGLYTPANVYLPYTDTVRGISAASPDLLVALGDQYYENRPTQPDGDPAPVSDLLYKWCQWLWSFGELSRRLPTVVLSDDHDVYQGNLWGHGGEAAPDGDIRKGGYAKTPAFVNLVESLMCSHLPAPYDATPASRGIGVYYTAFRYGGVSFAVVEGRKWKGGDKDGLMSSGAPWPASSPLLGARQEAFLSAWRTMHPGAPKVCLTQVVPACAQTGIDRTPEVDYDSNGWPPAARRSMLTLLRDADALLLCGDRHFASVARLGIDDFTDGPVAFTVPAVGTMTQRWFEPRPLPNPQGTPYTGDFVDAFGSRCRMLAVANPKVTAAQVPKRILGDKRLKSEGYGIVVVDPAHGTYTLHAYDARIGEELPGWPVAGSFR